MSDLLQDPRVLERRDKYATARLYDLMDSIVRHVPLDKITVAESKPEYTILGDQPSEDNPVADNATEQTEQGRLL